MPLLEQIKSPADVRKLSPDQLTALANEMRDGIFEAVSKNGGHLASNLGVVELTLALHYVYDFGPYPDRPGPAALGRRPPVLPAQDAHRPRRAVRAAAQEGLGQRLPVAGRIALRPVRRRPRRHRDLAPPSAWRAATRTSGATTTSSPSSATRRSSTAWRSKASTTPARSSGSC